MNFRLRPQEPPSAASAAPTPAPPKLSFSSVTKGFDGGRGWTPALEDFNLDIQEGEFVCIVGPSGCGKTTALNLAAGFVRPDSGAVLVDGAPIARPGPDRTVVFQEHALFPWLTARQNVQLALEFAGKKKKEQEIVSRFWLRLVHLEKFQNAYVHELSGGMKQRVQLARSFAINPRVLLMDEPFAALDALTREVLYGEFQQILMGTRQTVLFITHNTQEAAILADRVVVMGGAHPGTIKAEFRVDLPRPRSFESPGVAEIAGKTLALLKHEPALLDAEGANGESR
ncbi:MAG: ABC transporter ATP-binding protein [Dehalococcoidia bacterium]|nr:ABC transporter ATP-binding protein [Dehalococcoidia bacterium]